MTLSFTDAGIGPNPYYVLHRFLPQLENAGYNLPYVNEHIISRIPQILIP